MGRTEFLDFVRFGGLLKTSNTTPWLLNTCEPSQTRARPLTLAPTAHRSQWARLSVVTDLTLGPGSLPKEWSEEENRKEYVDKA